MKNQPLALKFFVVLTALAFLMSILPLHQAAAQATDAATGTPTGTPAATSATQAPPSTPSITSGFVSVKPTKTFVWVRTTPSSAGTVILTIYPNAVVSAGDAAAAGQTPQVWDGVQWWGFFLVVNTNTSGWIELDSLQPTNLSSTPVPTPATQTPSTFAIGGTLKIKAGVPFLWLRTTFSSSAVVLGTSLPSDALTVVAGSSTDGVQWWWQVKNTAGVTGWVEQQSVELGIANTTPVAITPTPTLSGTATAVAWALHDHVRVRAGIAFSWLRAAPNSFATVLGTVTPGMVLEVVGTAQFDGTQWWWQVSVPNTAYTGYVEQNSLERVN